MYRFLLCFYFSCALACHVPISWMIEITLFLLQEVLFALVVHSVGVSENGHYKAQAQESVKLWSNK